MKRLVGLVFVFVFLALSGGFAPVLANGPTKAAAVGNNPNVFINPVNGKTALNTPHGETSALDRITWLGDQVFLYLNVSNVKGLNNAIVADISIVEEMAIVPSVFENKWVYLSGESGGNSYEGHGMFYWWIRTQGFSDEAALASILARNPDGGYVKINYIG